MSQIDELLPPTERPGLRPPRRPCPVSPSPPQLLTLTSVHSIGNLRTAALISIDGSVESYCVPNFDSPSVFARILDKDKGGHFSITPTIPFTVKQNYLPSSNVCPLSTAEEAVNGARDKPIVMP